ncbi:MAG: glycosyltransferase, partial [Casimicrobiaceae bacterium]
MDARTHPQQIKVAVVDMQPITPAIGGGRLRLLGLYHALGPEFQTTYVGTFDWPGESARVVRLSDTLTEIEVPLSDEHFRCDAAWRELAGGSTIIDAAFPVVARLSPAFLSRARDIVTAADVVVFSHPWLHPLLTENIDRNRQRVIYDAQNVEALQQYALLDGLPFSREIAKGAAMAEAFLCRNADLIVGCSSDDVRFFADTYGVGIDRTAVVPNGVFVNSIGPKAFAEAAVDAPAAAPVAAGATAGVAIFLGSNFGPNVDAATFIVRHLAPELPGVSFMVCGGVADAPGLRADLPPNVRLIARMSDEEKLRCLHAADIALNPMFSGSGTNIKMLEFMAAGLPIIATPVGARGICEKSGGGVVVCATDELASGVEIVLQDPAMRSRMALANRTRVEGEFAWERLSPAYGDIMRRLWRRRTATDRGRTGVEVSVDTWRKARTERDTFATMPAEEPWPTAIMSTFGIRCGIAEYTAYFAEALLADRTPLTIIANYLDGHEAHAGRVPAPPGDAQIARLWHYDSKDPAGSRIDRGAVIGALRSQGIRHLNIQYHRAFFAEEALLDLVDEVLAEDASVSISLHNSSDATPWFIGRLRETPVRILVHRADERRRLRHLGIDRVSYLPHGVRSFAVMGGEVGTVRDAGSDAPLIATFGFLRPHKGLLELVEALAILRGVFPGARLHAQTSLYPSLDSIEYLDRVRTRIDELGLRESMVLDEAFVPIEDAIEALAAADLVVLPYAQSDEGASGAAAVALAARRPLITTPARIFEEFRGIAYVAEDNSPPVLAAAIATVLSNVCLRR